jgi:hypothetical protein
MAKGKTVTIRVPEQTFDQIKGVCSNLGDAYNFNQFVNQSLSAMLEVIHHDGEQVPIPKFAMMARLMKNYEESVFRDKKITGDVDGAGARNSG